MVLSALRRPRSPIVRSLEVTGYGERGLCVIVVHSNAILLSHRISMMYLQPRHNSIVHKGSLTALSILKKIEPSFSQKKTKQSLAIPPKHPELFEKSLHHPPHPPPPPPNPPNIHLPRLNLPLPPLPLKKHNRSPFPPPLLPHLRPNPPHHRQHITIQHDSILRDAIIRDLHPFEPEPLHT